MILYADTSALVKKYVKETGSEQVVTFFERYPIIGTTTLTQAEMAETLSKAARLGWVSENDAAEAWKDFLSHWLSYTRLPVSARIVERAASLAWSYGLRAYDSLHLSSALTWQEVAGEEVIFACFDKNLTQAAQREGLRSWPEDIFIVQ